MSKRPSPQDRNVQEAATPDFDQVWQEFEAAFAALGLSPKKPVDAMKMAFWLFAYLREMRKRGLGAVPKPRGRQPSEVARDAVILAVVEVAKSKGDRRGAGAIIHDLATANRWPTDKAAIETRRRRYQALKKRHSPERRRLVEALQPLLPMLERRLQQLQELEKAGFTPDEIEVVMDRIDAAREATARSRS